MGFFGGKDENNQDEESFYQSQTFMYAVLLVIVLVLIYMSGYFGPSKREGMENDEEESDDDSEESDDEDADRFVVSGARSDSNGGDWALKDKIQDINEQQRKYVRNSKHAYKYDMRQDTAAPAVYSPEDELQRGMYG